MAVLPLYGQGWEDFTVASTSTTILADRPTQVITDAYQRKWIATTKGLYYKDPSSSQINQYPLNDSNPAVYGLALTRNNELWGITNSSILQIKNNQLTEFSRSLLKIYNVEKILPCGEGVLLKNNFYSIYYLFTGKDWKTIELSSDYKILDPDERGGKPTFFSSNNIIKYDNGILTTTVSNNYIFRYHDPFIDSQKRIWILTTSGVSIYKDNVITPIFPEFKFKLTSNTFEALDSTIYMIFNDSIIASYKNNTWNFINYQFPRENDSKQYIFTFQNKVHFLCSKFLAELHSDNSITKRIENHNFNYFNFSHFVEDGFGNLFVSSPLYENTNYYGKTSLYRLGNNKWIELDKNWCITSIKLDSLKRITINYNNAYSLDHYPDYYILDRGNYLAYFDGENWISSLIQETRPNGLPDDIIIDLEIDNLGNTWIANQNGITLQLNDKEFIPIAYDSSFFPFAIYDLEISDSQEIWLGTNKGLMRYDGLKWKHWNKSDGIGSDTITQVLFDKTNTIWLYTYDGVSRFDGNNFINYDTIAPVFSNPKTPNSTYFGNITFEEKKYKPLAVNSNNVVYAFNSIKAYWYSNSKWHKVDHSDNYISNYQNDPHYFEVMIDQHDSIWINIGFGGQRLSAYSGNFSNGKLIPIMYGVDDVNFIKLDKNKTKWEIKLSNSTISFNDPLGNVIKTNYPYYYNSGGFIVPLCKIKSAELIYTDVFPNGFKRYTNSITNHLESATLTTQSSVVFPIPSSNELYFTENFTNQPVTIHNPLGQTVANKMINENNQLDISDLKSGLYFLQLKDKNLSIRFIKK
jgi:hypothetical protein